MDDQTLKVHSDQNGTIFAPYRISNFSNIGALIKPLDIDFAFSNDQNVSEWVKYFET